MSTVPPPLPGLDIPRLTLPVAHQLLTRLTRRGPLPLGPTPLAAESMLRYGGTVLGSVLVAGLWDAGQWTVREDQVRAAAACLTRPVDLADLVPIPRSPRSEGPVPYLADWKRRVRDAAECWCPDPQKTVRRVVSRVSPDELAGVRFLRVLMFVNGRLRIPRGYLQLLEEWAPVQRRLLETARHCTGCEAESDDRANGWRTRHNNYVTLCPPCAAVGAVPYADEHTGRRYSAITRRRGNQHPDANPNRYVCRLCPERATVWDHCHDHGYVRGPLCAGCNQSESAWLHIPAGRAHLWACVQCRDERTLPIAHLFRLAKASGLLADGIGCPDGCPGGFVRRGVVLPDSPRPAVLPVPMRCWNHEDEVTWSAEVPYAPLHSVVEGCMTQAGANG
ncbi:endonuclease domain-containing protein [Streptomyces sp. NY05-11A]|uniref:endonuclease domain-containing protein n=1 Tax=Streptomyces soliscabiei TaxID=588897 RepID=UPI0029AA4CE9|nr:endonuclease domain-containing protein [Streptomyces sp. NY05-11A]MDX2683682.1 endonuclease domain-containing protein [Streptomyces sp. NY05-11A]